MTFVYRALTSTGERTHGEIEAPDPKSAIQAIQAQGLLPIEANPKPASMLNQPLFKQQSRTSRVSAALAVFTRELATLLRAGEPLERAMALIADDSGDRSLNAALKRIVTTVRSGRSLAEAMSAEPDHFSRIYVGMVGAGEATGQLHQSLENIANLAERQEEARRKFIAAITYPAILCVVAFSAVGFMLGLVVPQFASMLEGHEAELPGLTTFVLSMSDAVRSHGETIAIVAVVSIILIVIVARSSSLRQRFDGLILRSHWLGRLPKERVTAQLARTIGTLVQGGLDLPSSLGLTSEMIDNAAAREALVRVRSQVRQGQRLADALAAEGILAPIGQRLIRTGEESGRLAELALYLADQLDRRIADRTAQILSVLEPILVVFLGIVVGGITFAILSAMLSVNELAL